jgi:hypothetical protein
MRDAFDPHQSRARLDIQHRGILQGCRDRLEELRCGVWLVRLVLLQEPVYRTGQPVAQQVGEVLSGKEHVRSTFCRDAGWSSGACPGWFAAADLTMTTNVAPNTPKPWSSGP